MSRSAAGGRRHLRFMIYDLRFYSAERGCLSRSTFDNPKPVEFRALIRQSGLLRL